jgi:hypothetical protein
MAGDVKDDVPPLSPMQLRAWEGIAGSVSKGPWPTLEQDDAMFLHGGPYIMGRLIAEVRDRRGLTAPSDHESLATASTSKPPPPVSTDLELFARSLNVILTMIERDTQSGVYGNMGRPNWHTLRVFLVMGLVNVPELEPLGRAMTQATGSWEKMVKDARADVHIGDIDELRFTAGQVRDMVEKLDPAAGKMQVFGAGGKSLGQTDGERAELLAMLDGRDPHAKFKAS